MKTQIRWLVALVLIVACDSPDQYRQRTYVKASDADAQDQFGRAIAVDGPLVVVGAPARESNEDGQFLGGAYILARGGGGFTERRVLESPSGAHASSFGEAVDVRDDIIVVGAPLEDIGQASWAGAVYVYFYNHELDLLRYHQRIPAPTPITGGRFGASVAVTASGIAVGEPGAEVLVSLPGGGQRALSDVGRAHVFELSHGSYERTATLQSPLWGEEQRFGFAMDADGDRLAISAPTRNAHVTVFERRQSGWAALGGVRSSENWFGQSVGLDYPSLVVGSPYEDVEVEGVTYPRAGAAHAFRYGSTGEYRSEGRLTVMNAATDHRFGAAVAISGSKVAVGAWGEGSTNEHYGIRRENVLPNSGAVYLFERESLVVDAELPESEEPPIVIGTVAASGALAAQLATAASTASVGPSSYLEAATAATVDQVAEPITEDERIVVARTHQPGSAFLVRWELLYMLKAEPPRADTLFGAALDLDGNRIAVGAPSDDSDARGVGGDPLSGNRDGSGAAWIVDRAPD